MSNPRAQMQIADKLELEDDVTTQLSRSSASDDSDDVPITRHVLREDEDTIEPDSLLSDRYEIIELVHSGGMGHVYKAIDRRRQRQSSDQMHVAIKMLRESLADSDEYRMTLEREATKAKSLSHPNIIKILDFDQHDGRFFIVMEWLEGESVNALLRRTHGQRLAPEFAWNVIKGAAATIHHAHVNNVVHADINPSNIFITATQDIKLLDFGVARCVNDFHDPADDWDTWVTQTYASPEVLSGLPPEFKDDVFSLGCVAYRLLADQHPFAGSPSIKAERAGVTVERIPGLADSDWQILRSALHYARSERPDTVEEFLREPHPAADVSTGAVEPKRSVDHPRWILPAVAAIAAVVAAVAVDSWFWPDVPAIDTAPEIGQKTIKDFGPVATPTEAITQSDSPFIETMLVAARQAVEEQRLVLPEGGNAREVYREILSVDPQNPQALRGLRSISDVYAERANSALKSGNPQAAASELAIASETDPGNPAVRIVADLLIAQGDAELTAARMAAATNDVDVANAALARAEEYAHIDSATINVVREQLDGLVLENSFLDGLAIVDRHIAADRLLAPAGNNAFEALVALTDTRGRDPRLSVASERLAERLLARAAFATAVGNYAEAVPLIDAADSLGVLAAEVDFAYEQLAAATDRQDTFPASEDSEGAAETNDSETMAAITEAEQRQYPADSASGSNQAASPAPREVTVTRLEDLGLERFVAPTFPGRAQRRGLTGYVEVAFDVVPSGRTNAIEVVRGEPDDVFDESAADAVSKWRFAPRRDTVRANVMLRFELAE